MSYCLNPSCENPLNSNQVDFCTTCGTNLLLENRYRATQFLGAGGMGRNFLAVDERTPRKKECVIKQFFPAPQILSQATAFKKAVELFNSEAMMLDSLGDKSTQIPRLLASIEQNKQLYFVQEFIDGENLLQQLQQQGIYNEFQIFKLLADLLPVMQFIHNMGVVHRDIKPENIMYRQNNQLVLIDFGISKELSSTVMTIGTTVGTIGYAPPEQMTYGVSYPASDIYGLGATCIHLLTNIPPNFLYNSQEKRWVWKDVLASKGIFISDLLIRVLDKMLSEDIRNRYQSVDEIIRDLQPEPTVALPAAPLHQKALEAPTSQIKRNKLKTTILASIAVTVMSIGGYGWLRQTLANSQSPQTTVSEVSTQTTPSSPETTSSPDVICNSTTSCYEKGTNLMNQEQYEMAIRYFDQAIKFDSTNYLAYNDRGFSNSQLGHNREALDDYNKAIEQNPEFYLGYYNRGFLLKLLKDNKALEDFDNAIKYRPDYAHAYYERAELYKEQNNIGQAIQDYNEAATLYQQQNNIAAAQQTINQVKQLEQSQQNSSTSTSNTQEQS